MSNTQGLCHHARVPGTCMHCHDEGWLTPGETASLRAELDQRTTDRDMVVERHNALVDERNAIRTERNRLAAELEQCKAEVRTLKGQERFNGIADFKEMSAQLAAARAELSALKRDPQHMGPCPPYTKVEQRLTKELEALRAERDGARKDYLDVASAMGFVEWADGKGICNVATPSDLIAWVRELERDAADNEALRALVGELVEWLHLEGGEAHFDGTCPKYPHPDNSPDQPCDCGLDDLLTRARAALGDGGG